MNIDLLMTEEGEAGLVSDRKFAHNVAGVMFDAQSGQMTLEFGDAEPIEMNIPVEHETGESLFRASFIHVGVIQKGVIADNRQVPLILINDPFGGGMGGRFAGRPRNSVTAFENFMKRCVAGQPLHRADLGDESSAGTVMGGISAAVLQFAPHLAKQKTLEAAPPELRNEPQAPGLGPGGRGGGGMRRQPPRRPPPREQSDDNDE